MLFFVLQTYNLDVQTPDSAATATAMFSGVKTNYGCIGVDGRVPYKDCEASHGKHVDSILDWALAEGESKTRLLILVELLTL